MNASLAQERSEPAAWRMLAGLAIIYIYAIADRHMMSLLVEPLRADLGITDTQFSVAQGSAFALALGLASVPAGRLVDRGNRRRVLAAAVALWSIMTLLAGLANGFAMLVACRVGVALGQAALNPATNALIADRFPPQRLGLALGIFGMAPHIGLGLANLIGAAVFAIVPPDGLLLPVLGQVQPWQLVMAVMGAPGLVMAAVLAGSSGRPRQDRKAASPHYPPLDAVLAYFGRNLRSFLTLKLATGLAAMTVYATTAWTATWLVRTHGWSTAAAGSALGPLFLVTGACGAASGGALGDWLLRYRPDGRVIAMMVTILVSLPFAIAAPLQSDPVTALVLFGLAVLFAGMGIAINPAATMAMMPPRMRGLATALGVMIVNLVGYGCGPTAVALMTEFGFRDPRALGPALAIVSAVSLTLSVITLAYCRPSYLRSIRALERQDAGA